MRIEACQYEGGWYYHRYHGVGRLMRAEYSKELKVDSYKYLSEIMKMASMDPGKILEQMNSHVFKRHVLCYDGTWKHGKRHGKGTMVFRRLGELYRFFGLFIENEPIFGEIEKLDLVEDMLPVRMKPIPTGGSALT